MKKVDDFVETMEDASKHKVLSKLSLEEIDLMVNSAAGFIQKARYYVGKMAPAVTPPVPPAPKTGKKEETKDG